MKLFYSGQYFEKNLSQIYWRRFCQYGPTAKSSFWLSENRQELRFGIIMREVFKLTTDPIIGLADIGCGYGALLLYLKNKGYYNRIDYSGYDICSSLISECRKKDKFVSFELGVEPKLRTMFTVMSGTYNLAPTNNIKTWQNYVEECLKKCWKKTSKAMIFNLQLAKNEQISNTNIYYADCNRILELCVSLFGPTKLVKNNRLPNDGTFVVMNQTFQ